MHARHRISRSASSRPIWLRASRASFATRLISIGVAVHEKSAQSAPYLYAPATRKRVAVSKQTPNEECVVSRRRVRRLSRPEYGRGALTMTVAFDRLDAIPPLSPEERLLLDNVKALARDEIATAGGGIRSQRRIPVGQHPGDQRARAQCDVRARSLWRGAGCPMRHISPACARSAPPAPRPASSGRPISTR